MRSFKKPTNEAVDRALALITAPEHKRYFLDRLENPEWVKPLYERDFFRDPPEPVRHEAEGTISFPIWAESRYLARVAADAGEEVLAIIEAMRDTENVRVHEDCIDAAFAMPAALAARIVPRAVGWLINPYHLLLPEKLGLLMEKLAREGQTEAAFHLAESLLDVAPPHARPDRWPNGTLFPTEAVSRARLDSWEYLKIVKERLPALSQPDPLRVISLLSSKLEKAIRIESRAPATGHTDLEDLSYIWRPAIENHSQNLRIDVKAYLVEAIRDTAVSAAAMSTDVAHAILDELESRPFKVFRRIALHVLCELPHADPRRLEASLRDRSLFGDIGVWHEYYRLLECHFGQLCSEAQQEILAWIDTKGQPREGDSADDARHRRYSQLRALTPIRECLPGDWPERHRALLQEFEEPDHPSFHAWHGDTFVGPTSPRTAEDLLQLPDADLIAFLRSWRPSGDPFSPSPRGLERALREAVPREPRRFAALAPMMHELVDPTYVAGFLSGLTQACRDGKKFEWAHPVSLCVYVALRPRHHRPLMPDAWDADQDWEQARQETARLLAQGLRQGDTEIPFDVRTEVWQAIEPLTGDPDPTSDHEEQCGGDNMSPHELAINTVRGTAFEAVVLYALWCMRHLRPGSAQGDQPSVLDDLPEIREVLERHLDPAVDPSAAVRSVYGRFLPWLVLLDASWVRRWLPQVFPTDPAFSHLRDAAWDAYVVFCEPYDTVLDVIEGEYRAALRRLSRERRAPRLPDSPEKRLGEHILILYGRGRISLDDDESLLRTFFESAPAQIRAEVIGSAGWQLQRSANTVAPQVGERLRRLWEFRVDAAAESPKRAEQPEQAELLEFFSWFASGVFEPGWSLTTLQTMLEITRGRVAHGKLVLLRLASLAQDYPAETTSALTAIVEGDKQGLEISWWSDEMRTVLAAGLSSRDEDVRSTATDVIHRSGSRGFHQFRDLLEHGRLGQ